MSETSFSRPAEPLSPPRGGESRPAVPDTEPVHTKVRIGAWTAESFAFLKRYFPRVLLLAFLHGLLFIGISPYWFPPPCRVLLSRTALILFFVSGWMILGWTIRAVKTDSGSWKNLLFPSRRTLPNLVVLAALVFFLWFAGGYLPTHCRAFRSCPNQLELRCLFDLIWILVLTRLALSAHLVIDRGFGPFRALKNSWRFTRGVRLSALSCPFPVRFGPPPAPSFPRPGPSPAGRSLLHPPLHGLSAVHHRAFRRLLPDGDRPAASGRQAARCRTLRGRPGDICIAQRGNIPFCAFPDVSALKFPPPDRRI